MSIGVLLSCDSQDDILMGTLSVRENLHFSAALRLPSNTTRQQRRERVERVIQELGLEQVSNSKVNDGVCQHASYASFSR